MEETAKVQETTQETPQEQSAQPQPDVRENNLVAMRKKMEAAEAAQRAAEARALQYEQMLAQQAAHKPAMAEFTAPDEDDLPVDNEDYVQGKVYKATHKKTRSKLSEQEKKIKDLEEKISLIEAKTEIDRLKDWNEVVTEENLATFKRLYPDEYDIVASNPDLRKRSKAVYNMMTHYGIANPLLKAVDERVEANKRKPQSASVSAPQTPTSPLAGFNSEGRRVMTEAERDRILQEIERKRNMPRQ
jgi:hypothetical protein